METVDAVDQETTSATDPALARFLLRNLIQRFAREAGRGSHALAAQAGVSERTWKRWVALTVMPGLPQIRSIIHVCGYDETDEAARQMIKLAQDARRHNVISQPEWLSSTAFDLFMAIERVCDQILTYENTLMPGLCQTADYARAFFAARPGGNQEEKLRVRIERQAILDDAAYTALIDEAVLHRAPGDDPAVMRGQLAHLLEMAERPNITIRIIPFKAGPYGTDGNGPFVVLDSRLVGRVITYVETSAAATYYETPEETQRYADGWTRLTGWALGTKESRRMISSLLHAA